MNDFLFRIASKAGRETAKLFRCRPASRHFITGDGFRAMADHVYDEMGKCAAGDIHEGDVVFLRAVLIGEWFKEIHPRINARYKLVTHNGDENVGEREAALIDDKIIRWFAQNNTFAHSKITPIPIGIENRYWFMSGWTLERMAARLKAAVPKRRGRILFGFNASTNPAERGRALAALRANPSADEIRSRLDPPAYFRLLNGYDFVASPNGNGIDCHRTWEALYLNVTPIVTKSRAMEYLKSIGVPLLIVDRWNSIDLTQKPRKDDASPLSLDYWAKLIRS